VGGLSSILRCSIGDKLKYITCDEVNSIMSGLDKLKALKCLGDMNNAITRYEEQLNLRYRRSGLNE